MNRLLVTTANNLRVTVATVVFLLLAGCTNSQKAQKKPVDLIAGIDVSGGARNHLGEYALGTLTLSQELTAGQDHLTIFRIDNDPKEIYDHVSDGDTETTFKAMVQELKKAPARPSTCPAAFWQATAKRASETPGGVAVVLFSDGDNDDPRAESRQVIIAAAQQLGQLPQVRLVLIAGVTPSNRATIREQFAPLGQRLILLGPSEITPSKLGNAYEEAMIAAQP